MKSRRRCCICYFIDNIIDPQKGQIAHINHNSQDNRPENLVYLCLRHHDEYDSTTSQAKGFSESEIRYYRDELFHTLETAEAAVEIKKIKKKNKNIISDIDKSSERPFYLSRINKPWRLTWLDEERPELFAYKAMNGCDGICRVEQCGLDNGYTLFICEDIEENPGKSTTNSIESIAFQLCKRFKVKPEKLILVEHYRESSISKESWLMVEFSERNMKSGLAGPTWRQMEAGDWNRLGYKPRKSPIFGINRSSMLKKV